MSEPSLQHALRRTCEIAYRSFDQLPTRDKEAVLVALVDVLPAKEGQIASESLFHLRACESHQLQLKALLGGIGGQS